MSVTHIAMPSACSEPCAESIRHAALWACLSPDMHPEPFAWAADPESIERLFSELYGADSERHLMPCQATEAPKPTIYAYMKSRFVSCPASCVHCFPRRR